MEEEMLPKQNPWDDNAQFMKLISSRKNTPTEKNLLLTLRWDLPHTQQTWEAVTHTASVVMFKRNWTFPKGWDYGYLHLQNGIVSLGPKI